MATTYSFASVQQAFRPAAVRTRAVRVSVSRPVTAAAPLFTTTKPTLFDVPVSNNGARIRWLLYKKGLEDDFDIIPPAQIGGVKSREYLAMNPQGKMPLLALPCGTALPESQVIESYILDKYKGQGPDLLPETPELRALAALVARIHDQYMAPIQGCMYKPMPSAGQRAKQLNDINFQLGVLEWTIIGPYVCGEEISYADGALLPTFVFYTWILPRHFGWESVFTDRPKLEAWWKAVSADPEAARVIGEMHAGLQAWEDNDRWNKTGVAEQVQDINYNWTCDN